MSINQRIKELRLFHGKSQEDFASQLGLRQSVLSRIEKGTLSIPVPALGELFRLYQVHPNWLFFGEGATYLHQETNFKVPNGHVLLTTEDFLKYETPKV